MKNLFRKAVNKIIFPHSQLAYAQSGEDLILAHIFYKLNIPKPTYLDIGANHPTYISNTYYFYLRGSHGVCVEPNPSLYRQIKKVRPKDIVINAGVGVDSSAEADFYLFPPEADGLSTFSKTEAEYWGEVGMKKIGKIKYKEIIKMPLIGINEIIEKNFDRQPDFISLDVEGLDLAILKSLDYSRFSPKVICVETLLYDENQIESKNNEIIYFLTSKGYSIYADTHVNTIFTQI
ncbi:MAG: FkbM family methyltransferase [Chitinophagaceae bacterium]|nr:FkbM family methyltransferase [Chitinophagaceae bacterium]MBK9660158.1 FkbM family methyltransferase [Chitinophagaceae bacterium]HQW43931.1 FkbM family methyltransferase [Chitinophagaceae bacterium]